MFFWVFFFLNAFILFFNILTFDSWIDIDINTVQETLLSSSLAQQLQKKLSTAVL